jgi:pimeloyl-ACP methyl ester carboxylesterase
MHEAEYRAAETRYWLVVGVTPEEVWLDLPDLCPRVRVQVVGEGPPVLFVHGGNVSGTSWAPLAGRLDGYRCLLLDRPGCGLSAPLTAPVRDVTAFAALADWLIVAALDSLELEAAPVVATSLGGYHALRTAAAHPDRVSHVVELGYPVGAPNGPLPWMMRLAGVRGLGKLMARMPVPDRAVRPILAQAGLRQALAAGRLPQEGVDWYASLLRHTNTLRNEIDASPIVNPLRGMNAAVLFTDDLLAELRVPMHFVWGEEDPFGGSEVATRFVAKIPNADLEIVPGAGHAVWMDDPDGIAATIRRFLAEGAA